MNLTIRPYQPSDLDTIKRLTVEGFDGVSIDRNIEDNFGPINRRDWRWRKTRHIDFDVARDPGGVFVAECEGEVVGYITTFRDRDAGMGLIPNLAVDADYRGNGIGRKLIEYALKHFREVGLTHAKIETLEQNEVGQGLYPSLGFREVARQIHYCMALDSFDDG
ncbi:MAG: GNAT family N-acetyltransferase [Planctomycetaceae bacterium]|nr:GNAT family N-acetyltransferase [Planctomycetales bacterium]MCB9923823.1 GNAT family N-acetyltransferase [Planctomycetaceae bacterium]